MVNALAIATIPPKGRAHVWRITVLDCPFCKGTHVHGGDVITGPPAFGGRLSDCTPPGHYTLVPGSDFPVAASLTFRLPTSLGALHKALDVAYQAVFDAKAILLHMNDGWTVVFREDIGGNDAFGPFDSLRDARAFARDNALPVVQT